MPPKKAAAAGSSDYEAQRQAKIAQNKQLLKELQLNAASAGLAPSKSSQPRNRNQPPKKKEPRKIKQEDALPTRTSSRLKGIVADSEVAKRKADEDAELVREQERAKRLRKTEDQSLGDIVVNGSVDNWSLSGNWLRNVKPANPYERTFDDEDIKKTPNKELRELQEQMSNLQLWEDVEPARIKITPERIYAMGFHPTVDKPLVFAGDKLGNLGCFDASQAPPAAIKTEYDEDEDEDDADADEARTTPTITALKLHTRTISAIHSTPSQPESVYTSSYDSSIRKLDLNKALSTEVYGPDSQEIDDPLSGLAIPAAEPHTLYFTTLNGGFGMHDTRARARKTPASLLQLSDKKIGGFSIHPTAPHLLATASLDRTLKLWDLRAITGSGGNRLPALLAQHESKLSVSHAAFNAAGQIATSSYDDTVKIHDLPRDMGPAGTALADEAFAPATVVPHNNQTGRWVTILRPQWQAAPERGPQRFCIGNMNRFVDVYAGTGEQLAQLGGDGITAVPAVAVFHERKDWIAAGTASGKLALWM